MNQELMNIVANGELRFHEPLSMHTSYGIGGPANVFIRPADYEELRNVLRYSYCEQIPIILLGSGSNCLVNDKGIDGIVISLAGTLDTIHIEGKKVTAEAGVPLGQMIRRCVQAGLAGMESLVGIPGTVGGALTMNAGAFGQEISTHLTKVHTTTLDGHEKIYSRDSLQFGYRSSGFSSEDIIIKAEFQLEYASTDSIQEMKSLVSRKRSTLQPLRFRSAGSVFKNPSVDKSAGILIDQAGLKGSRRGNAEISRQHGNFILNHGQATAEDVAFLIKLASRTIKQQFGIQLEMEIKPLGFESGYWKEAGIAG